MVSAAAARLLLPLAVAAILYATLLPNHSIAARELQHEFSVSDLLRNLILFAPLGVALGLRGAGARRAIALGGALSAAVEMLQLGIPGRHGALADVLANAGGTGLGILVLRSAPLWLHPGPGLVRGLGFAWGLVALVCVLAPAFLFVPAVPESRLFVHRPPRLAHLYPYGGQLRTASLDGQELAPGEARDSADLARRLAGDHRLRVTARAGPPPPGQAGLLLITDLERREIALLGPDGTDLVYRYRSRAKVLGLEGGRLRLPDLLSAIEVGSALDLRIERVGADLCVALDGRRRCGHGFTAGDGWRLLAPDFRVLAYYPQFQAAVWLAALFLPLGYWARPQPATALLAIAPPAAALFLAPASGALLPTPVGQIAAASAGALAGYLAHRLAWPWGGLAEG